MPIWLRRFTFSRLKEYYEARNEDKSIAKDPSKTLKPDVLPKSDYNVKSKVAAKK